MDLPPLRRSAAPRLAGRSTMLMTNAGYAMAPPSHTMTEPVLKLETLDAR